MTHSLQPSPPSLPSKPVSCFSSIVPTPPKLPLTHRATRANPWIRSRPWRCDGPVPRNIAGPARWPPATNHARARLSLAHGGLGLRSATHHRHAAYWASWADTLPAVHARWPAVADQLGQLLTGESRARPPSVQAAVSAAAELQRAGFAPPPWGLLITGSPPPPTPPNPSRGDPLRGWQRASGAAIDQEDFAALFTTLPDPERALLLSQAGPHAAATFTTIPTCPEFHFDNPHYRTLLLRRLRLPLGFAPARCRCGRPLDAFGDHRAACATSGALRTRAVPVERTLARILREAGARVHMHVPLAHMNLDPPPAMDAPSKSCTSLPLARRTTCGWRNPC